MSKLYFKCTGHNATPCFGGIATPIPPGEWTDKREPRLCLWGWHACRWEDVPRWLATELWVVETSGDVVVRHDKVCAASIRLVRKVVLTREVIVAWAADCAERVLHIYEDQCPGDTRVRDAIKAARVAISDAATAPYAYAHAYAYTAACASATCAAHTSVTCATRAAYAAAAAPYAYAYAHTAVGASATCAACAASAAARAASAAARAAAVATALIVRGAYVACATDAARNAVSASDDFAERRWQADRLLQHYLGLDPEEFAHNE